MSKITLRRTTPDDASTLRAIHTLTLPNDVHEDYASGHWWLAHDAGNAIAFAGMRGVSTGPAAVYMARCGVLHSHRGQGLQRRLLTARERAARRLGFPLAVTTTYCNPASSNSLIRSGYRMYSPATPWGAEGTCYWWKDLK